MTASIKELDIKIIGKSIAGIVCHQYHHLGDIVVILDDKKNAKAIKLASLSGNVELHTIDNESIERIQLTGNGRVYLFHTKSKIYLVNDQNKIVEDSSKWHDHYFDELSNGFYRQDALEHWYDIEGFKMQETVFLKDDVLTCLNTKKSKQSISFKNQPIYISANKQLIQVGKVVLDLELKVVKYFGEKITGLGNVNISFGENDVLQEVKLGLEAKAFINEFTHEPFVYGDDIIVRHEGGFQYGQTRVEIFHSNKNAYALQGSSNNFLSFNGKPLQIDVNKYVHFNNSELVQASDGNTNFFFDLIKNRPFQLPQNEDINITELDNKYVRIGTEKMFNVSGPRHRFVVSEKTGQVFSLDEGSIEPEKLEDPEILKQYFGFATIDGQRKLFSKKHGKVLHFGVNALEVSEIKSSTSEKLINAIDTNGNKLVLDLRSGFDDISLATTGGDKIFEVYGAALNIGNKTLHHVFVETLGGNTKRVIDINQKELPCFTLPKNLKQISDQEILSVFAGNFISGIEEDKTVIDGKEFVSAYFESFSGKHFPVILEKASGQPIHLEGVGHRNELAMSWVEYSLSNTFYLGRNRMVGVRTLTEDLKETELLFSIQQLSSWLPFYDHYLPILKQVIEVKDAMNASWNYHLFELKESAKEKEYIAVEKKAPHRILADKKTGSYHPRIVKGKNKSVRSPEELNTLQRFFYTDTGDLVEVE